MICLGFILLSRISELWQLYAVYLLIGLGWSSTHVVPVSTMVTNWFIRKRGVAMSVTMTGMSIGGVVVVPIAGQAIHHWGLKISLPIFGVAFWVVVVPIALFLIKRQPSDKGLLPDGDSLTSAPEVVPNSSSDYDSQTQVWTRREAMSTRTFWAIVVAFLLALAGQAAFLVHEISFMSQFVGPTRAATAISVTSGASILGRLSLGAIIDRFDKRYFASICFLLQGAAILTAGFTSRVYLLYLCVFAFGLAMGNIIMLQSLIIGECFGRVSFGTVSGLAGLFVTSVTSFGPMIAGLIYDATLSYRAAFCIFAVMSACASLSLVYATPPKRGGVGGVRQG
jgi:sugar phosphate permease